MFDLDPISTTNLFTIAQIVVVAVGFYFSWKSLEATRENVQIATRNTEIAMNNADIALKNAQAQLLNQIVVQGRDLQFKFVDIFYGSSTENDVREKRDHFIGSVIGYYASCFEVGNVFTLPQKIGRLLEAELQQLMQEKQVRDKWDKVKNLYSKEFVQYVNGLGGVK